MKVLIIVWRVLVQLIVLFVVFAMFSHAGTPFETIVISGLTLIYVSVTNSFAILSRGIAEDMHVRGAQFVELTRLLNHPEASELAISLKERTDQLKQTQTRFWINVVASSLIGLVAIWNLLNALAV